MPDIIAVLGNLAVQVVCHYPGETPITELPGLTSFSMCLALPANKSFRLCATRDSSFTKARSPTLGPKAPLFLLKLGNTHNTVQSWDLSTVLSVGVAVATSRTDLSTVVAVLRPASSDHYRRTLASWIRSSTSPSVILVNRQSLPLEGRKVSVFEGATSLQRTGSTVRHRCQLASAAMTKAGNLAR